MRLAALVLLFAPAALAGQRLAPVWQSTLASVRWPAARPDSPTIPRTYWLQGGIIGGVGLGVFTGLAVQGLCESSNCTGGEIAAGLVGGAVGFTVGALIGGQFRKGAKKSS